MASNTMIEIPDLVSEAKESDGIICIDPESVTCLVNEWLNGARAANGGGMLYHGVGVHLKGTVVNIHGYTVGELRALLWPNS